MTALGVVPNPPRNLTVTSREPTSISVAWVPPAPRPNAPFNDVYIIFHSNRTGPTVPFPTNAALMNVTNATVSGLLPDRFYTLVVVAVNQDGNSRPSNNVSSNTLPGKSLIHKWSFYFTPSL